MPDSDHSIPDSARPETPEAIVARLNAQENRVRKLAADLKRWGEAQGTQRLPATNPAGAGTIRDRSIDVAEGVRLLDAIAEACRVGGAFGSKPE